MKAHARLKWSVGLAVPGLAAMLLGCATTEGAQSMRSGASVPASEGTIKVSEDKNGNTKMTLKVSHLAPASKLAADATVYVVWIKPRNGARQSVGVLTLNDSLEGHLDTVTPHSQFLVIVTPEPSGHVPQPTHEPVFTSQVQLHK